ncbi:laminin subunit alpha-1 [Osmerus mordax]|uniref:laminin subunit alpha-1 n=1 Tax=Osmerus mordax TaxID=8014 RepID=UPI00350F804D
MRVLCVIAMLWTATVECQQRGLFPAILTNLASNADISTNATCGDPEPEMYCKLVEHVPGRPIRNPQCRICDANSSNPKEQHPITNAIDGTNRWWQSPSIKNGRQFHWVTITLDLRQIFQVAYVIIKAANSPRSGNWILERSLDGVEFTPWQYYAISDTECLTHYNITPRLGPPTYKRDDEVICTSYYSRLVPLEHGEIHTSLINGRPSADDLTPKLLDFTSARYIRLRLQRIRTLNADLMTLSHRDPKELDPIVTRRYYYSIKDISVGGMCICYGHAQSCPLDPVTKKLQCECEHNTCGESCNECCPGYHQEPWQPGTRSFGTTCEKCNCHGKAEDCYYNQTVAERGWSINMQGRLQGGGVCISCTQNTTGVNCETCADRFYRPLSVSPYDEEPCEQCDCDMRGSQSAVCIRDEEHAKPDQGLPVGQCVCKEGFAGRRCDRCAFGYRDFPLCSRCECSLDGSLNIDPCRPCICKENVMGAHCDLCKQGFFNLQGSNPEGCTECFCFGVSGVCESSPWSTSQVVVSNGWLLPSTHTSSVYTAPIADDNNLIVPGNTTSGPANPYISTWAAPDSFLGNRLASYGGYLNYSVAYDISIDNEDKTLPSHFDLIIEGNGRRLLQTPPHQVFLTPLREQRVAVEMVPEAFVDLVSGRQIQRDEVMTVLADLAGFRIRAHLNASAQGAIRLSSVSLDMADPNAANPVLARPVEQCECPWGYAGTSCEYCVPGFYRVDGILFGGNCLPCECNEHASQCDINGACLDCTHNTTGPHCNQCQAGYYGDATEGTPEDCQRCACPLTLDSNNFSPTCVLEEPGKASCDQCQLGYTGTNCERCANGYHGDPTVPGQVCEVCDCNGNVDRREAGHCDSVTGACLKCIGHTSGRQCESCQDGYYGDAITAKNCQPCGCHGNGSYSGMCDQETGRCSCRANVDGDKCDHCQDGFHGLLSGQGCVACNCSQSASLSQSCDEEGRCQCIGGVAGDKCEHCHHGYYNYQDNGCTKCDCAHTHGSCHRDTGECICPPHTEGEKCEMCEEGYWGHDPVSGCKSCDCSEAGSSSLQCDLTGGHCLCRAEFSGRRCDRCAKGHRDYPQCKACNCNVNGTQEEFCDAELGVCDCQETGACLCKVNVGGAGCDECVTGTFGLSGDNPAGCSPCYCSGVSPVCEELGGMVRTPITLGEDPELLRLVSQSQLQGAVEGVYQQGADMLLDTREIHTHTLTGPYYWRLPSQYQGNKLLSYGGRLSYSVAFYAEDGTGLANHEPQVLIRGGHLRKLVIYTDLVAPDNGVRTRQDVPLTEHQWKYFNSVSEKAVSHVDFLSVLSKVEYVIIKASYGTGMQQSRIANITMETALDVEDSSEDGDVASLIESCECPAGYAGLSCQECAPGYYRQPVSELDLTVSRRPLMQPCVPCRCSNHSLACDTDTGECLGCQHHTAGGHCNVCAPGYYGQVKGSVSDCSLCACPLKENSFSPTCALDGLLGDFLCEACQPGYEGRYCERCSMGYYGNPSLAGGRCQPCQCSESGSLHAACDALTGQCECRPGVRGHLCDQCQERHVLEGDVCVSCADQCTGVLLDDLEEVERSFLSINLTGVILAPYMVLVSLENDTRDVLSLLSWEKSPAYHLDQAEAQLDNLNRTMNSLLQQATRLSADVEEVDRSTFSRLTQGTLLLENIDNIHTSIQALAKEAGHLNRTEEAVLDEANRRRLLGEAAAMLESIRKVDLTPSSTLVAKEQRDAEALLQVVQQDLQDQQGALENRSQAVASSLSLHSEQLEGASALLSSASQQINLTHTLLERIPTLQALYQDLQQNVSRQNQTLEQQLEQMQEILAEAVDLVQDTTNITYQLEVSREQVEQCRPMLRKHVDSLVMDLRSRDALELVYRAEDHAQDLSKQAAELHRLLAEVRNSSLNATSAAQANSNIRTDVQAAQDQALSAHAASDQALNMTIQSQPLLTEQGAETVQRSNAVLEESLALNHTAEGLVVNMTAASSRLAVVKESVRNASRLLPDHSALLVGLANGTSEVVQGAKQQIAVAGASLQRALERLEVLRERLEESGAAVARANTSVTATNTLVSDSHSTASAAEQKLQEAESRTERLMERLKPLRMLGENLGRNLSDIREMINQARKQAASIKVAVQADRDCVRAYRPEVSSSNYNSLTLTLKTTQPDNLLFYMGSPATVDYLALEMHAGKVALLWNTGSGHTRLEHPDITINDNSWHRINVTRFGRHGSLTVHRLESEPLRVVKGSSPGDATVMDVNNSTLIYVGGLGERIMTPPELKQRFFRGCLGDAVLNERNIGLWNYAEREGACKGCFMSPQSEETSFHFDGSGYSVLEKPLRPTATFIVLLFKTLSPNGLLLYLASNGTRDFLSIELVEGRVRLTFELGSGPLPLTSTRAYNTGVWYKITLQRNKRKGYLSVMAADNSSEKEILEGESPGSASDLNRSDRDPIYIGGLPMSRPIRRQVVARSYVGCIKNMEIARSNFDLLRDSYGVKKGCVLEPIRSVSVLREGFVELGPVALGQQGELFLTFSTRNDTGVILAGFSRAATRQRRQTRQPFLAVQLVSGKLEVQVCIVEGGSVHKTVVKPRTGTFSDGLEHSLILHRNRKTLTVRVDEDHQESMRLSQSSERAVLSLTAVFLGGLPPSEGDAALRTTASFHGCLRNLALNAVLVDLSRAVRYQGVDLDSCLLEERAGRILIPDDPEPEPTPDPAPALPPPPPPTGLSTLTTGPLTCASEEEEPGVMGDAHHFGVSRHSHMVVSIHPNHVRKSFSLKLSVRTSVQSGLLYYMAHANQMDYATLQLQGGHLVFTCDLGKGPASASLPLLVNDGHWHTVKTDFNKKTAVLSVDGQSSAAVQIRGNTLDVESQLYLGGLPHTYTAKKIGNVTHSLVGCIQSVMLNGVKLNTQNPLAHHGSAPCFTHAQKGSFFNGSGHAALMRDGYKVGSDVSVSLQFRTWAPEGVLLGVSSAKVDAIGLEITNGQVVFHVNNGAGRVSVASVRGSRLCDGLWHTLLARKTKNSLRLTLDGVTTLTQNPHPQSTSAETNDPVYVGGFPVGVKQNCLTTRSSFRGCMRNIHLIKGHVTDELDLSTAFSLMGVTPHSCPASAA